MVYGIWHIIYEPWSKLLIRGRVGMQELYRVLITELQDFV